MKKQEELWQLLQQQFGQVASKFLLANGQTIGDDARKIQEVFEQTDPKNRPPIGVIIKGMLGEEKRFRDQANEAGLSIDDYPSVHGDYINILNSLQATARMEWAFDVIDAMQAGQDYTAKAEHWKKNAAFEGAGKYDFSNPSALQENLKADKAHFTQRFFAQGDLKKGSATQKQAAQHQLAGQVAHMLTAMALESPDIVKSDDFKEAYTAARQVQSTQLGEAIDAFKTLPKNNDIRNDCVKELEGLLKANEKKHTPSQKDKGWASGIRALFAKVKDMLGDIWQKITGLFSKDNQTPSSNKGGDQAIDQMLAATAKLVGVRYEQQKDTQNNTTSQTTDILRNFLQEQAESIYGGQDKIPDIVQQELNNLQSITSPEV